MSEFIMNVSKKSQLITHQLLWNMKTNMYTDEDAQDLDGEVQMMSNCWIHLRNHFCIGLLILVYESAIGPQLLGKPHRHLGPH